MKKTVKRCCSVCGENINGTFRVDKNDVFYCPICGEAQFVTDPEPKHPKKKGFWARICGK